MAIADKLTYLNETKSQIKSMINYGLETPLTNEPFRDYVSSIFKAFIESLNNPDTLWGNLPKITGTGTNISLNNTIEAPMKIELSPSELTQDATPTPSSPQAVHSISGSNTIKIMGKNLFDDRTNNNEWISTTGNIISTSGANTLTFECNGIETYTLKADYGSSNVNNIIAMAFYNSSGTLQSRYVANGDAQLTITATSVSNTAYIKVGHYTNKPNTIQLEVGSTATTYEEYKGTDYSIDLGYENLFDVNSATLNQTRYYIQEDGSVVNTHNWGGDGTNYFNNVVLQAGTYTLSYIPNLSGTERNVRFRLYNNETSSNIINSSITITNDVRQTYTFTLTDKTTLKICIMPNQANGGTITIKEIMLNKGTTALPYTPYNKAIEYCKIGNYEDKFIRTSGKNLLDIKGTATNSGITMTAQTNGIYISGTSTGARTFGFLGDEIATPTQYFQAITLSETNAIKLKAGTYTLSYTKNGTGGSVLAYVGNYGDRLDASTAITNTFTISEDKYLYIGMYIANATATNYLLENIQLEKNSEATSFEPYGSNEWYIKKNIGKVVLDGTQNITLATAGGRRFNATYSTLGINNIVNSLIDRYCDHFIYKSGETTWGHYYLYSNWLVIQDSESVIADASALSTWFSNNNTSIYYPFETPTYTQITGTLANQLEAVKKSKDGVTNISQVNNDLSFNLSVQAIEE